MKRLPILSSLLALILLSASIAYWILQLYQPPQRPLAAPPQASLPEPAIDAAATLFGGQAATAVAANYQLTGVVAAGRDSVAIIVAEGTPPKALKVGKEISPGVVVSEVHPRYVMLSDNGVMKRIDMPAPTAPVPQVGAPGPQGTVPEGEPQTSAGAVEQPEQPEMPVQEAQPAVPAPAVPSQPPPQPAPVAPGATPGTVPPPPAPVQMPPPVRSPGSPVTQPPTAR